MEDKKQNMTGGESTGTKTNYGVPLGTPIGSYYADEIICVYKGNCTDESNFRCSHCKNNRGKRSHYEPDRTRYVPCVPYYPYVPYIPNPYKPYKPYRWCNE